MALFGTASYDRTRILANAVKARRRGRRKKAIELYRRVLEREPNNADLHRRIAPMLAQTKQHEAAIKSFHLAAVGMIDQGFDDRAIGVYREAARHLPLNVHVWEAIAKLQLKLRRKHDAVKTLLEGRRHFRGRKQRPQAMRLLLGAREVNPNDYDVTLDLARLIGRSDRAASTQLFERAASRCRGRKLRRVRGAHFRVTPTPRMALRWLRALFLGR